MKCHQCNHDSIKIKTGHIYCDICDLDIDIHISLDKLYDLFIYNENLENAEKLGSDNYIEGKGLVDNPYSLDSDSILNSSWERGYNSERESYENEALIMSSGKIEEELRGEVERLELDKEYYKDQSILCNKLRDNIFVCIEDFCCKLLSRKILSIFYGGDVKKFMSSLDKKYYKENPDK